MASTPRSQVAQFEGGWRLVPIELFTKPPQHYLQWVREYVEADGHEACCGHRQTISGPKLTDARSVRQATRFWKGI